MLYYIIRYDIIITPYYYDIILFSLKSRYLQSVWLFVMVIPFACCVHFFSNCFLFVLTRSNVQTQWTGKTNNMTCSDIVPSRLILPLIRADSFVPTPLLPHSEHEEENVIICIGRRRRSLLRTI